MAHVLGYSRLDFQSKSDNKRVQGYRMWLTEEYEEGKGIGREPIRAFFDDAKWSKLGFTPSVGQEVLVTYNRRGRVSDVQPVDIDIELD